MKQREVGGMAKKVTIGIQARSTSIRLPGKVNEKIGEKTILQKIIDEATGSAKYLNRHSYKNGYAVNVVVCCPIGDEITKKYRSVDIVEGDEFDVLGRYSKLAAVHKSDVIVRITADCPLIPSFVISSLVMKAVMNGYDYISNVDPLCRTTPDGWDCEVISRALLDAAHRDAKDPYDREHVTTYIRNNRGQWKHGTVINHVDFSNLKFSVDTKEELELARKMYADVEAKLKIAEEMFGASNVHRL